jgi:hypothetical protein
LETASGEHSFSAVVSVMEGTDLLEIDPMQFVDDHGNFTKIRIGEDRNGSLDTDQHGNKYYKIEGAMQYGSFAYDEVISFRLYFQFLTCNPEDIDGDVSYDPISKSLFLDVSNLGDTSGYDYQWVRNIKPMDESTYIIVPGANATDFKPTTSGDYAIEIFLQDIPWCKSLSNFVSVEVNVGIETISSSLINVYPNPVSGEWITCDVPFDVISIEIISQNGTVVPREYENNRVSTAGLSPGMYVLRIVSGDMVGHARFIKM